MPEFKSRLVSRGNFEDAEGVRTDAPTSDIETHALPAVFAACHGVPLFSSDIKNAYFQAMPIDRIVIMRQPQGGLPGVDRDVFLLIRVPVHGLCDSGGPGFLFFKGVANLFFKRCGYSAFLLRRPTTTTVWCHGPLVPRSLGPLVLWSLGVLVPWSSGPVVLWFRGPLVLWSLGPLVFWSSGPLVLWSRGPLVPWSLGPLVPWFSGPLVLWSFCPWVLWSLGPLVPWLLGALTTPTTMLQFKPSALHLIMLR